VDSSTESDPTSSTSDAESAGDESTAGSDGSTSESGTEGTDDDDSTEGETGSEAVPTSLVVESAGERIGYLMNVWDYGFRVWDDVNEVTFNINQLTGHVVGVSSTYYFQSADCTGQRFQTSGYANPPNCGQIPVPIRRNVIGSDMNDFAGFEGSPSLIVPTGQTMAIMTQSVMVGAQCVVTPGSYCVYPVQVTNVIPKTFALPIEVAESAVLP
jgi:hypothetical protein